MGFFDRIESLAANGGAFVGSATTNIAEGAGQLGEMLSGGAQRAGSAVSGGWGGARELVGLVQDFATAEWRNQEEFDGFANWLRLNTMDRFGQMASRAFGPDEGVGSLIGAVPQGAAGMNLRESGRQAIDGLEWAYKHGVAEPLTTAMTAGSLADSETWQQEIGETGAGGFGALVDPKTWKEAWALRDARSPGQALYQMFATKDVLDEDELQEMVGSDAYHIVSGTTDAFARFFADPTVLGAKAAGAARMKYLVRPIDGGPARRASVRDAFFRGDSVDRKIVKATWNDVDSEITRMANEVGSVEELAGRIRGRWFRTDDFGDVKATMLAAAPDSATRESAMRFLMGDLEQYGRLDRYAGDLRRRVDELTAVAERSKQPGTVHARLREARGEHGRAEAVLDEARRTIDSRLAANTHGDDWWRDFARLEVRNSPEVAESLDGLIHYAGAELNAIERARKAFAQQPTELRASQGWLGDKIAHSQWFQNSTGGRAIETFMGMRPHHIIDLEDTDRISEQLRRSMSEADLPTNVINEFRGRLAAAPDANVRLQVWREAEATAFRTIADDFGVDPSDVRQVLEKADMGRNQMRAAVESPTSRAYAEGGGEWLRFADESGNVQVVPMPLAVTQNPNFIVTADFAQLRRQMGRLADDDLMSMRNRQLSRFAEEGSTTDDMLAALPDDVANMMRSVPAMSPKRLARAFDTKPVKLTRQAANSINYYWKASALLRPGWPQRVVLLDEALRPAFKFGALAMARQTPRTVRNYAASTFGSMDPTKAARWGTGVGGAAGFMLGGPAGAGIGAALLGGLPGAASRIPGGQGVFRKLAALDELGYPDVMVRGHHFDGPFGAPADGANVFQKKVSQTPDFREFIVADEHGRWGAVRQQQGAGQWATLRGTDDGHLAAWTHAVNNQIGQDRLWRQALEGIADGEDAAATMARMVEWLDTADGIAYRRKIPWRTHEGADMKKVGGWQRQSPQAWVETLYTEARKAVSDSPDLAGKAARGAATEDDLARLLPNAAERPPIHGEVLAQTNNSSGVVGEIDSFIQNAYHKMGGLTSDKLAREPTFALFYRQNLERQIDSMDDATLLREGLAVQADDGVRLRPDVAKKMEHAAREHALNRTRNLMFDLAERSQFGEMTRMILPFFDAYREVLMRWSGVALDNPAGMVRASMAWEGLDQLAGAVDVDEETGAKYLQFRVPESLQKLVDLSPRFRGALDGQGYMTIPKESMKNIPILGGPEEIGRSLSLTFGFGPWVQAATSEIVKSRPTLEDNVKFILPYGPSNDTVDAMLPAWARRARSRLFKHEDDAYASAWRGQLRTLTVQHELGMLPDDMDPSTAEGARKFEQEVDRRTNALFNLRGFANFVGPFAPNYQSPYQPYVESYRQMQEHIDQEGKPTVTDGLTGETIELSADEWFVREYGEEFFAATTSLTRVNDGIPASIEGYEARQRYQNLIEAHPELGGLIVGDEAGGFGTKFSYAMYQRQKDEQVGPLDQTPQREYRQPEEYVTTPQERMGWNEYMRHMDRIEFLRVQRGLPNLQVKEAADLAETKRQVVARLEEKYPAWRDARAQRDERSFTKRLQGLYDITADERLAGRDDIRGIADYLERRERVLDELARRAEAGGSSTLDASENQDLAYAWDTMVAGLTERNPDFAEVYVRWLEGDPMLLETRREEVS